jgi:hypothetical protein
MVELYKVGNGGYLRMLMSVDDLRDMGRAYRFVSGLQGLDRRRVAERQRTLADLRKAQAVNDRIYPIVSAFYADPFVNMHNRMKQCLAILGRVPRCVVRPPLAPIRQVERQRLRLGHGTSEQRSRWFRRGLESGKPESCDTFAAQQL